MSIKNRIKKIEERNGVSGNCACKSTPKFETIYHEDGKPATSPELISNPRPPVPPICPDCGKPVNKTLMIIDFVSSAIPKPEGAK